MPFRYSRYKVDDAITHLYSCVSTVEGCTEGDVRLQNGNTAQEGRVEVCKENLWGTVCSSGWSSIDARVVCRQLGFSSAGKVVSSNS